MGSDVEVAYHDWADYCFRQAAADWLVRREDDSCRERLESMIAIAPRLLVHYLADLMTDASVAVRYTEVQIAGGVEFVFSISEYFHGVWLADVGREAQIKCMKSVARFYLDVLDKVCDPSEGDRGEGRPGPLALAVNGIWDHNGVELPLLLPHRWDYLVRPALEVLGEILMGCRTYTCLHSAMYGIDTVGDPRETGCAAILERVLVSRDAPNWLREAARRRL